MTAYFLLLGLIGQFFSPTESWVVTKDQYVRRKPYAPTLVDEGRQNPMKTSLFLSSSHQWKTKSSLTQSPSKTIAPTDLDELPFVSNSSSFSSEKMNHDNDLTTFQLSSLSRTDFLNTVHLTLWNLMSLPTSICWAENASNGMEISTSPSLDEIVMCRNGVLAIEQAIPGAYQQVCMMLPERSMLIQTSTSPTKMTELIIRQRLPGPGSTGMAIWSSSILLSRLLQRLAQLSQSPKDDMTTNDRYLFSLLSRTNETTVIELGCGTGFCSLVAATTFGDNTRVIATDGNPSVIELASQNVQYNQNKIRGRNSVEAVTLQWGSLNAMDYVDMADMVIGSDLTYYSGNWPSLAETMETTINPTGGVVLYLTLGHSGFPVSAELNGFLNVAKGNGLVPLSSVDTQTRYWNEQPLTQLVMQVCSDEERRIIQATGGVKAIALCSTSYKKR